MNNATIKALKQENLFKEGEQKYYIQIASPKGSMVINVGKNTYNKVINVIATEGKETAKKNKEKIEEDVKSLPF